MNVHKNAKPTPRGRAEIVRRILDQGQTPDPVVQRIAALRRQRWSGAQIAAELGVSTATVSRVLRRLRLNRLKALESTEPVRRYERQHPGELIHIDIKKLDGREFVDAQNAIPDVVRLSVGGSRSTDSQPWCTRLAALRSSSCRSRAG